MTILQPHAPRIQLGLSHGKFPFGQPRHTVGFMPQSSSPDICRNFNNGRCKKSNCYYSHACLICQVSHAAINGPRKHTSKEEKKMTRGDLHQLVATAIVSSFTDYSINKLNSMNATILMNSNLFRITSATTAKRAKKSLSEQTPCIWTTSLDKDSHSSYRVGLSFAVTSMR